VGGKPNYHGFLFNIAPSMDKVLQTFKEQEARHNVSSHWIGQSINLLFKEMKTFYKPVVKIKEIEFTNLATIPVIGGFLGAIFSYIQGLEWYWITLIIVGAIALLLTIMIPFILGRMLDLNHPYFYLPAYKTFRKNEFNLLNHTVYDKHVSYVGLAQFVNGLITKEVDELAVVNAITQQYNLEKETLRKEIIELREKEEFAIQAYDTLIEELEEEIRWYETVIEYLVQLFHELYVILHRIGKGNCGYSDLKLISGFTLYKKEGNKLKQIADEGATGQNPLIIDLARGYHNPWVQSIVEASQKQSNLFRNEPKEGYFIVSYRMNIGYNNNETWIISLQIAPSVNKRGFLLALTDDIIDQRVIFSMLHGLCQIINNSQRSLEKGDGSYGK
jgi:hypothetical protein